MLDDTTPRRAELGEFIRSHRARLTPQMLGLDAGVRRRTPGLRREEVAQLAGVSATWYTWIEQGRDVSVSPAALMRLARVLRLNPAERAYLFELAAKRDPEAPADRTDDDAGESLGAVVGAISAPAYLLDRAWNAMVWNDAAAELFVGWLDAPATERNLLRFVFLSPLAPRLIADWEARALRLAAEFRVDYSRHLVAAETRQLVDQLRGESRFFERAWLAHEVTEREGGERTFTHPTRGFLRFQQTTFLLARHQDVKLVVLLEA